MRSSSVWNCLWLLTAFTLMVGTAHAEAPKEGKYWVFLGTNTGPKSKGIYRCEFDAGTGKLSELAFAAETVNPSFVAIHPSGKFLYAVGEVNEVAKKKGG